MKKRKKAFSNLLRVIELRTINERFYAEFFGARFVFANHVRATQAQKHKLPLVSQRSFLEDLEKAIDIEIDLELDTDKKVEIDIEIVHTKVR